MGNAETNGLSHFSWSYAGMTLSYIAANVGINLDGNVSRIISSSLIFSAGIGKEVHDYISTYPSFYLRDTSFDLAMNVLGISTGVVASYIVPKLWRNFKSVRSKRTTRKYQG